MTEQAQEQISLQDIAFMVKLIDICTKRGAFEGNELATIGAIREKFDAFVKANTSNEEQAEAAE